MLKLIPLAILQSIFQVACQMLMKMSLNYVGDFKWKWAWFGKLFTNWYMVGSGLSFAAMSVLWMYILKRFPFSVAYPMTSIAYVMGMVASLVIFHEQIPLTRWIGIGCIMIGCYFIAK